MEKLFYLNNKLFLYIQESEGRITYTIYRDHDSKPQRGNVSRTIALNSLKQYVCEGNRVVELAISTLEHVPGAVRMYHKSHKNVPDRCIRIVSPNYDELFRIPDGNAICVSSTTGTSVIRCHYIDAYHLKVNDQTIHIKEFYRKYAETAIRVTPEEECFSSSRAYKGTFGLLMFQHGIDSILCVYVSPDFKKTTLFIDDSSGLTDHEIRNIMMENWAICQDIFHEEPVHRAAALLRMQTVYQFYRSKYAA